MPKGRISSVFKEGVLFITYSLLVTRSGLSSKNSASVAAALDDSEDDDDGSGGGRGGDIAAFRKRGKSCDSDPSHLDLE